VISYFDTSAWIKLTSREQHTDELRAFVADRLGQGATLMSSDVIQAELRRAALRIGMPLLTAGQSLDLLATVAANRAMLVRAGSRVFPAEPGRPVRNLKTLDAIHIETALAVGADELITYDQGMARAANSIGLPTLAPGQ